MLGDPPAVRADEEAGCPHVGEASQAREDLALKANGLRTGRTCRPPKMKENPGLPVPAVVDKALAAQSRELQGQLEATALLLARDLNIAIQEKLKSKGFDECSLLTLTKELRGLMQALKKGNTTLIYASAPQVAQHETVVGDQSGRDRIGQLEEALRVDDAEIINAADRFIDRNQEDPRAS